MPVSDPMESPLELAKAFVRGDQPRYAVEVLEPWLEAHPDDAGAWSVMAAARFELDNLPAARLAAAKAVDLKPQSARNWCNLGMVLRRAGELYEAERAQHRALILDPRHERARIELRKLNDLRTGEREDRGHKDFI
jgi:Flp pilus assembly protein TadD